jgi:ankyrin repeat protein
MKQFIGSLFVGYSGIPLITEACNEKQCRRRSTFRVIVNYQFPKWFWTRALFASVVNDVMAGPEMLLRVPRQVPFTSEAYQHCLNGDVTSLKLLFDAGKASPFDVDPDGTFLLNSALRYDKYQMCQYLVSKGADLYQEDQSGFSPYHIAWDMVLSEPKNTPRNNFIISLFPQEEGGLDERQFNRIHKIVLELIGTPLEAELGISTASIDEPDNLGRTPLFWAASRGDDHRVRLLLEHGASPQIRATKGNAKAKTPLHAAARSGNHECLSLLLQHGAQVEISDGEGLTPLFLAAGFNDGNKCVKILLEHGADINARAPEGHTPLMTATTNGMLNNSEVLLAYDPDIDNRDGEGWTALSSSVFWNMHESIRLLVLHGASPETVTDEGDTLLHVAARYGDLDTLRILMAVPMSMQSDTVNTFGETALDVAKRRDNVTPEWHSVFQDLQESVLKSDTFPENILTSSPLSHFMATQGPTTSVVESVCNNADDSDQFEDARETWT